MTEKTDGYYTFQTLGPGSPDYRHSGFTEAQVLELGKPIAHFMGPFAKRNANRFYEDKIREVSNG